MATVMLLYVTIVFLDPESPAGDSTFCFLTFLVLLFMCFRFSLNLNSSRRARKYWRSCKESNPAATVTFAGSSCVRRVKIWARDQGFGTGAGIQAMVLRGSDLGLFRKRRVFFLLFLFDVFFIGEVRYITN